MWGRPPGRTRSCTGPRVQFRGRSQPSPHRILLNIARDPPELLRVPHQPVVALVLPERLTRPAENLIASPGREPLERARHPVQRDFRTHQEVHMIRHHDKRVQLVAPESPCPVVDRLRHHLRQNRLSQIPRPAPRAIQQPVHRIEGAPGVHPFCRERPVLRQAAVKPPGHEDRMSDLVEMRQPAMVVGHAQIVALWPAKSLGRRPEGAAARPGAPAWRPARRRGRLPHVTA